SAVTTLSVIFRIEAGGRPFGDITWRGQISRATFLSIIIPDNFRSSRMVRYSLGQWRLPRFIIGTLAGFPSAGQAPLVRVPGTRFGWRRLCGQRAGDRLFQGQGAALLPGRREFRRREARSQGSLVAFPARLQTFRNRDAKRCVSAL